MPFSVQHFGVSFAIAQEQERSNSNLTKIRFFNFKVLIKAVNEKM
jgi:hypothetical protein